MVSESIISNESRLIEIIILLIIRIKNNIKRLTIIGLNVCKL